MKNKNWFKKRECFNCDGMMHRYRENMHGIDLRGWKCKKCNEIIFMSGDVNKALVVNQLKHGIPIKIGSLGNNKILRIPKSVDMLFNLKKKKEIILKMRANDDVVIEF